MGKAGEPRIETEIKFRLADGDERIRLRLGELGATSVLRGREVDIYLDEESGRLSREGRVLRLRRDAAGVRLTYKGPPAKHTVYAEREEHEVGVGDLAEALAVLMGLGYRPATQKEKDRETFAFGEVTVCLDRLPFLGHYLEIEGPRRAIARAAAQLGLDLADGTNRPYLDLYRRYWQDQGVDPDKAPPMQFSAEEDDRARR